MNISIVNGLVLQNVQTDWRRRRRHFDFRLLLAKQAFSDFNGYKKHSSAPVSRRNDFDLPYVSMVIVWWRLVKEKQHVLCVLKLEEIKRTSGRTFESVYQCAQCAVNLCRERGCLCTCMKKLNKNVGLILYLKRKIIYLSKTYILLIIVACLGFSKRAGKRACPQ